MTLSSASCEMRSPPGVTACVEMVWCSQVMGTLAASKMTCTALPISGPMPSPGKMVARKPDAAAGAAGAALVARLATGVDCGRAR
jgi:hypothetical protein